MNWKRSILIVLDAAIAVYLALAVTVFNRPDDKATVCSEVKIDIEQGVSEGFLNPDEVKRLLMNSHVYPLAAPMAQVDTRLIEETLLKSPLVEAAECYKTQGSHVCIELRQRMPVLRVKANNGDDYYLDSQGNVMPSTRYSSNLVVATGWISRAYAKKTLAPIANQLINDAFWNNQVVQLNVLFDGSLEMVPRVGEHIAYLGAPSNIGKKLERLRKFYKYGLSQAGWNKYAYVSVEFDNQIICKKVQTDKKK